MWIGPLLALGLTVTLALQRPMVLLLAAPLLLLWLLSPSLAWWISQPRKPDAFAPSPAQLRFLRVLARRTWAFFDTHVGPADHWLPPDNLQEQPGPVIAQVTEPVFDHRTGRTLLIPQGARLIGRYDSAVGYGQARLLVVWTQIVFPSGRSVDLGAMVGLDAAGMSGLAGQTDRHLPGLARAIGLSSLISIGGAAAQNSAGPLASAASAVISTQPASVSASARRWPSRSWK